MKATNALMIRSRDIIHGGRLVVVDGHPMVLPVRREPAGRGQRSSGALDNRPSGPSVSRGGVDDDILPAMTAARPSGFGK